MGGNLPMARVRTPSLRNRWKDNTRVLLTPPYVRFCYRSPGKESFCLPASGLPGARQSKEQGAWRKMDVCFSMDGAAGTLLDF